MPLSAAQNGLRLQLEAALETVENLGLQVKEATPEQLRQQKAALMAVAIHTYAIQALVLSQGGGIVSGVAITPAGPYPVLGSCIVSTTGVCT